MANYTYGLTNCNVVWKDIYDFKVGKFCSIADNIKIYLGGNHSNKRITTYPFGHIWTNVFPFPRDGHPTSNGGVTIGNDVWVASCVTIMSGVTIGDGAVIACNSHVVKDVEPYSLHGGNPARFIKYRFSKDIIDKLLVIKWWDWDEAKINQNLHLLCSEDDRKIQEFVDKHYDEAYEKSLENIKCEDSEEEHYDCEGDHSECEGDHSECEGDHSECKEGHSECEEENVQSQFNFDEKYANLSKEEIPENIEWRELDDNVDY